MKRTRTSKQWMKEHVNDPYVQRARGDGYRSRAAYKLLEISTRDKLFSPGMVVVDLGAAPGGWSQVARAQVGARGVVIAIDMLEMAALPGVTYIKGDFRSRLALESLEQVLAGRTIDLVLSDMAPNISGISMRDQAQMIELAELVLAFAGEHLKPGGRLLVKAFQGSGFESFFRAVQAQFQDVKTRKPAASRGRSSELYVLARGVRPAGPVK